VKFGLIGYGLWGPHHANALVKTPGIDLVAIAAASENSAQRARKDHPNCAVSVGYRDLLARGDVQAVVIVTQNHTHREIACAALEAGKDVLLEKPMSTTVADCDAIIAAWRKSGRMLTIGHEFRLSEQWGRIKGIVESGTLGEPMHALVSLFRFPYRQGSGGWRYAPERVGSWILEEPVHFFDQLLWYFEKWGLPDRVRSFANAKPGRGPGMLDNLTTVLRWPSGLYATVNQTLAGFEHHHVMEIVGREGSIRSWWSGAMDRTLHPTFEFKIQKKGETQASLVKIERSGELFELEDQARRVLEAFTKRQTVVSPEEGRRAVAICLAAERSAVEDREIELKL